MAKKARVRSPRPGGAPRRVRRQGGGPATGAGDATSTQGATGVVDEVVKEFLVESYENLDRLERTLVELEQDPRDQEKLADIFRTVHTIKGCCGFLGFSHLESISHAGEDLLSRLRDGTLVLNAGITTVLLEMNDAIRGILVSIEATGGEADRDPMALIDALTRHCEPADDAAGALTATARHVEPADEREVAAAGAVQNASDDTDERLRDADGSASADVDDPRASEERPQGLADSSLRVDVGLLDSLMTLVGELVIARNQILQFTSDQSDAAIVGATQRLNLVTAELQEGVMKTRMQPIGNVWNKFPRVVRDLAVAAGKQIRVEMDGRDTELDKTIVEAVTDPLTHVIRNAVDHGIETPDVRVSSGKAREGVIRMRAFQEGGQIHIEIADDGAGIDPGRIRAKAVEREVVTSDRAAQLSDQEVMRFVFLPGFSTADRVSHVSGRGVGMDVVKTNIEKIGGTVDIQSQPGEGTTLKLKIPLTLAIVPALLVVGGTHRYAIPQVSLLELVRLEGDAGHTRIERIGGALFYRLRGQLLPLVDLDSELNLRQTGDHPDRPAAETMNIVVLKADDRQFGLIVNAVNDTEEIVVKPLGAQLKGTEVFAGAAILGDGQVALILDVLGLARKAQVVSDARDSDLPHDHDRAEGHAAPAPLADAAEQTMLVFRVHQDHRMAIPLNLVARLEEFPDSVIERSADQEVVQYRGEIMPLISLVKFFYPGVESPTRGSTRVIVFAEADRSIGLVVEDILDIVSETLVVQDGSRRRGVLGSAVIQQRVTDLLDVHAVTQAMASSLPTSGAAA